MALTLTTSECLILAEASGTVQKPEMAVLTGAIDELIARRERFLVVGDALACDGISAAARQFVGEHRKSHAALVSKLDLGLVLAIGSPVVRGAMTAISWFSGDFANLRSVDSRRDLGRAAREVLSHHDVRLGSTGDAALEAFVRRRGKSLGDV